MHSAVSTQCQRGCFSKFIPVSDFAMLGETERKKVLHHIIYRILIIFREEALIKSFFSVKKKKKFCSTSASCSWSNHKTAGTIFFGHVKSVQHVILIGMAGWWFVFVLQPSDLDTLQSLSELGWNWVMQQDNDQKHSSKSKNKKQKTENDGG